MDTTNVPTEVLAGTPVPQESMQAAPSLADVISEGSPAQPTPETHEEGNPIPEPGYLSAKKAKWRSQWEEERSQEMTALKSELDGLREYVINDQADKLVASGKVSDKEIALELVRNRHGQPMKAEAAPATNERPRDAQGRFVSPNNTPTNSPNVPDNIQQRANELFAQAQTLQKFSGVDVLSVYRSNPEYAEKVNNGEWDMADVLTAYNNGGRRNAPPPVRNANVGGIKPVDFRNMTAEQFAKVNAALERGGKYNL